MGEEFFQKLVVIQVCYPESRNTDLDTLIHLRYQGTNNERDKLHEIISRCPI